MRKLNFLMIVLVCVPLVANAQLGRLGRLAKSAISDSGSAEVDGLIQQIDAVQADFTAASDKLLEAYAWAIDVYASQEKKKEFDQRADQIKKIEKPDQKAKETAALMVDSNKVLEAVSEQDIQSKKLSDQQKADVARMSYNVLLAVLKDKAAVGKAKELAPKAQSAARDLGNNPQNAPKARKLASAVPSLQAIAESGPTQISAAAGIVQMLAKVRKANGIPDPPQPEVSGAFK